MLRCMNNLPISPTPKGRGFLGIFIEAFFPYYPEDVIMASKEIYDEIIKEQNLDLSKKNIIFVPD